MWTNTFVLLFRLSSSGLIGPELSLRMNMGRMELFGKEELTMKRKSQLTIAIAASLLAVLTATGFYAQTKPSPKQDKYTLKSPSGIAFSDFRGYEDWSVVSSARTDEVLKVIVANPIMIKAFKEGIPGNGKPFPEGSKIAKLQWKPKKSTEAPFVVDVPDHLTQDFLMEKDTKRFPKNGGGWGYAVFNYDPASDQFSPDAKSLSDCGNTCHTPVKAKDYIFHPYQKR
jgi:Cytochrome P460